MSKKENSILKIFFIALIIGLIYGVIYNDIFIGVVLFSISFILGLAIFKKCPEPKSDGPHYYSDNRYDYRYCILVLLAQVSEADGERKDSEFKKIQSTISRHYKTEEGKINALNSFNEIVDSIKKGTLMTHVNIDAVYDSLNYHYGYAAKSELIMELLELAYADGEFHEKEESKIMSIVYRLEISNDEYNSIYALFKKKHEDGLYQSSDSESDGYKYDNLKFNILVLIAHVAKLNRFNSDCEFDNVKKVIQKYYDTKESQESAFEQFQFILNSRYEIDKACDYLNKCLDYKLKLQIIYELLTVADKDKDFTHTIDNIAKCLKLTTQDFENLKNQFNTEKNKKENKSNNSRYSNNTNERKSTVTPSKNSIAYNILGLKSTASDAEVKKAYRTLAMKYHPDNVAKLGDEAIRQATETMKQINMAWETVKMARGMK
ncbi:MAG: TerB family tellurite resistance protein [Paludibacteraceae bacterium]|nr:TerB family tellurite resistance protein [Paludibacteraceae bacterium]